MLKDKNFLILIGGGITITGSVLPWINFAVLTMLGTGCWQGMLTALVGAIAIVLQYKKIPFSSIIVLIGCVAAFVSDLLVLSKGASPLSGINSIGMGVYIALGGLAITAMGAFQDYQKSKQPQPQITEETTPTPPAPPVQ